MELYKRLTDENKLALDARLKATLTLYVPTGQQASLNNGEPLPGAIYVTTAPGNKRLYFTDETGAFIACATMADVNNSSSTIYTSLAAAQADVPTEKRSGRTVSIIQAGKIVEYIWHPDNVSDAGLVEKYPRSTIGGAQDFGFINNNI